jgi:hypothetical protein
MGTFLLFADIREVDRPMGTFLLFADIREVD